MLQAGLAGLNVLYLSFVLLWEVGLLIGLLLPPLLYLSGVAPAGIVYSVTFDESMLCFWDACDGPLFKLPLDVLLDLVLLNN